MATIIRGPRYPASEISRRGKAIYEGQVKAQLEPTELGRVVVIDIETGEWELADTPFEASRSLRGRLPDAQPWITRVGHLGLHSFGGRSTL
jgi:hypothetical protein